MREEVQAPEHINISDPNTDENNNSKIQRPKLTTMSAYTTTFNIARPKRLLVFGVSANKNLNLRDIDISKVTAKDTPYTDATKTSGLEDGHIAVPGCIVALPFAGWTRVFALSDLKKDEKTKERKVAMISPVHSWLGDGISTDQGTVKAEGARTALTGCSDGEDEAYLYYMNQGQIQELKLDATTADPFTETLDTLTLSEKTQLSATWGADGFRYLAYQLKKNKQLEISYKQGTEMSKLQPDLISSTNALEGTPMAIVQFKVGDKSFCRLYYLKDTNDAVVRLSLEITANNRDWKYSEISQVGRKPAAGTALCAIWSEADQKVVLTYATGDAKNSKLASFWD